MHAYYRGSMRRKTIIDGPACTYLVFSVISRIASSSGLCTSSSSVISFGSKSVYLLKTKRRNEIFNLTLGIFFCEVQWEKLVLKFWNQTWLSTVVVIQGILNDPCQMTPESGFIQLIKWTIYIPEQNSKLY